MRKIIVSEFVTLDGVMEDPGGSEKTEHGGWNFKFWSDEAAKYKLDELGACGGLLLGRTTYQAFAEAWPSMSDESGFADRMNGLPKFVVSTTLQELTWNNSTLVKGNLAEGIRKLKDQPGKDIFVYGSRGLVRTLMQNDLIDEFRLMVHPVVLGSGKRLFEGATGMHVLKLNDMQRFSSGVVVLTYAAS